MPLLVKNVEHGMTTPDGKFIPFRASSDYDTARAGEPKKWASKWKYEDKPRKHGSKRAARKAVKKTAKVSVKSRPASGLRAYALAASKTRGGRRGVAFSRNPKNKPKHTYEVIVGNIGRVWEGTNLIDAGRVYAEYVLKSKQGIGRAAGEDVSLWKDYSSIIREHYGSLSEENPRRRRNPIPAKWTTAKVMRTRSGDIKVMLTGHRR
jgi:hypothetical protein